MTSHSYTVSIITDAGHRIEQRSHTWTAAVLTFDYWRGIAQENGYTAILALHEDTQLVKAMTINIHGSRATTAHDFKRAYYDALNAQAQE